MIFESDDFKITKSLGIINDSSGSKTFDAKIQLNAPCPFENTRSRGTNGGNQ
jgi:hypothetical protein